MTPPQARPREAGVHHVDIGRRMAIGTAWLTLARLGARIIDFCLLILLGRVLSPSDFGLMALATSFVVMIETLLDMPIAQALVRVPEIKDAHFQTAFTLSAIRAATLCILCTGAAWPFAAIYHDRRLAGLVAVLSLAAASRGLISPRLSSFARAIDFRRDFFCDFSGKLLSFLCTATLAILHPTFWALAMGAVTYSFFSMAASYVLAPHKPRFSLKHGRDFGRFVGWASAAQFLNAINWQGEKLLLSGYVPAAVVGSYSMGSDIAHLPGRILLAPLTAALMPAFSMIQNDPARLTQSYVKTLRTVAAVTGPILMTLAIAAKPLILVSLGGNWAGAAIALQILALAMLPSMFATPIGPLVMALDQTRLFFQRNLFELLVKIPLLILGGAFGHFDGFLAAVLCNTVLTTAFSMSLIPRFIPLPLLRQLLCPWRTFVSLVPMCLVLAVGRGWVLSMPSGQWLGLGALLAVSWIVYGVATMAVWSVSGRPAGLESFLTVLIACRLAPWRPLVQRPTKAA